MSSHETAQRLREEQRGNRASTTQGSMSWYMSEREWYPIPAQSFGRASPPCFILFHLPLLGTVRSKFGFLWEGSSEVHLAAYTEGTGKNKKGPLEVPKKAVPSHIQGMASRF